MYHNFFVHSSVDRLLGCFHVLAVAKSAAMILDEIKLEQKSPADGKEGKTLSVFNHWELGPNSS